MITVVFSRAKAWYKIGSDVISFTEKRPYSHASLKYEDPITEILMVSQASHGFINEITYDNFLKENIVVEEIVYNFSAEDTLTIIKWCKSKQGNKYATDQILSISIKKLFKKSLKLTDGDKKFICSEYVLRALMIILDTINTEGYVIDEITPSDLNLILKRDING